MTRYEVLVGDVLLDVERLGSGPPLLFLHGEDGLAFARPFVERLAQNWTVHAPQHPGWGNSQRPKHLDSVQDIAFVYDEFLTFLDEPAVVVGASFGGWIAAEILALRSQGVRWATLISPTGVRFGSRTERNFVDLFVQDFNSLPEVLYGDPMRAPDLSICSDELFLYLAQAQEAMTRYCWSPYMHRPGLSHLLRRACVPTLLLSGTHDKFVLRPTYYAEYADLIPGASNELIEGAGHRLEEEEPDLLADLIEKFAAGDPISSAGEA